MSAQILDDKDDLNALFNKNMAAIKSINLTLYEDMSKIRPTRHRLIKDSDNNFNIYDGARNIYSQDPKLTAELQVKQFQKNPTVIKSSLQRKDKIVPEECSTLNQLHMGLLLNEYPGTTKFQSINTQHMPFLIILGSGLGHHIEILSRSTRNLVIFEKEPEIFFLSLFTTDYTQIIESLTQSMRSIIFAVGKTPDQMLQAIYDRFHKKKNYLLANTYIYSHYTNNALDQDLARIKEIWHRVYTTCGFTEDEFHGLSHFLASKEYHHKFALPKNTETTQDSPLDRTYSNLENNSLSTALSTALPTAFILGSGPSINEQISAIKAAQNKFIIFSCSSSIDICYRNGIVPDFHVEMERHFNSSQSLAKHEDKHF